MHIADFGLAEDGFTGLCEFCARDHFASFVEDPVLLVVAADDGGV